MLRKSYTVSFYLFVQSFWLLHQLVTSIGFSFFCLLAIDTEFCLCVFKIHLRCLRWQKPHSLDVRLPSSPSFKISPTSKRTSYKKSPALSFIQRFFNNFKNNEFSCNRAFSVKDFHISHLLLCNGSICKQKNTLIRIFLG